MHGLRLEGTSDFVQRITKLLGSGLQGWGGPAFLPHVGELGREEGL